MSKVRNKNTSIELVVRKALFVRGFRYKINDRTLPATPDIVLPKYKAVIFVHGCFWHGHNCPHGKLPKSNQEFWSNKIKLNKSRDRKNIDRLINQGWRVATVWECSLRGKTPKEVTLVIKTLKTWLTSDSQYIKIP
ncbi:very short patch repair endonuclease [Thiosulfatimonas sediminis]|uniref:Very short patch repair endonuclease n=2 Tax=Thiosulfatimonas sediminis TaxID=2675054 RepID=A0A6F8PTC3_9GAMM|nr:very short patch repair endonuclease [Thiosulfatimonas sediminis]